ncbi:MAG TPA: 3'(2'),5'-bisphosphate nucleotidase CysQ [Xanthobacteraceae bacterium]|nr:3'(2'),5'-bisphosphate nucleotidase CysQ [Xanthobacteraceae bacterium]
MRASEPVDHAALAREVLARELAAAVRAAGALALKSFKAPVRSWFKHGGSPVSEADLAVDALLRERLAAPGLAWLSEESEDDPARLAAERVWIVDPIDGTRAFLAGLPDWSIAIALVQAGRPILGAVYAPVTDEFFLAAAGDGARLNDRPIAASDGSALAGAHAAGPERRLARLADAASVVAEPKVHSLALRIARVAQGRLDIALVGPDGHDWDLAAADLLVHEAGGALTTLGGEALLYNRPRLTHGALLAAGSARHRALLELMREGKIAFR